MSIQSRSVDSRYFWVGTFVAATFIFIASIVAFDGDVLLALFPTLVFCWLGGCLSQIVHDVIQRPQHQRPVMKAAVLLFVYYCIAGVVYYLTMSSPYRWLGSTGLVLPLIYLVGLWQRGKVEPVDPPNDGPATSVGNSDVFRGRRHR